jgi:hypothetical protein
MAQEDAERPLKEAIEEIQAFTPNTIVPLLSKYCDHDEHKDCTGFYAKLREKSGAIVSAQCICDCHRTVINHVISATVASAGRLTEFEKYNEQNPIGLDDLRELLRLVGLHRQI